MEWEHSVIYTAIDIEFCSADGHDTVKISWEQSQSLKSITVPVDTDISIHVGNSLPVIVFVFKASKFKVYISMCAVFSDFSSL